MPQTTSGAVSALEALEDVLMWGLRIAAVVLVAITGYYIYATLAQGDALYRGLAEGKAMGVADYQRHIGNMQILTRIMLLASIVLTVCAIGRFYGNAETGVVLALVGVGLFYGMPFIISSMGGPQAGLPRNLARIGNARDFLPGQFAMAGLVMLTGGVLQLLGKAIQFGITARDRRPQANADAAKTANQVRKKQDQFLGPCWNLPFCRDTEKKLCPIRQSKKPCWRTGRGCYCDQNIILTLSGGSVYNASRGSAGYLSRSATVARPKSLSEKREQCLQCPVYLHHQSQKYRVLAPGVMIGIVAAVAVYWGTISQLFPNAVLSFGRAVSGFSFGTKAGEVPAWAADMAQTPALMWMVLGVLIMLLLAYSLQAVEWCLYRLGI